jgi:putative two-component system response regulator
VPVYADEQIMPQQTNNIIGVVKLPENTAPAPRKTVVIVDDDAIILKLARNALMGKYNVFTVPSAAKLFQLLRQISPDLILLDILMPDMNGFDIIRQLKQDAKFAATPVIFLSSRTDSDSELEGLGLGAVDYLGKPFSSPLLLKRVDLHILLETQHKELQTWNSSLQELVQKKTDSILKLQKTILQTISNLVECRDDITGKHVERTERILRFLVQEMMKNESYAGQLQDWDLNTFFLSSQLHDVGKIAIPDAILLKPGKLDTEEFNLMKRHTTFGEMVIEKIQQAEQEESMFLIHAKIMAGMHHERWDGSGYPRGLRGNDIPLQGQMMALADVYEALISTRPYKTPISHQESIRIINECSGTQFNPALVQIFNSAAEKFVPAGQAGA